MSYYLHLVKNKQYGDLLVLPIEDTYAHLMEKTKLAIFHVTKRWCFEWLVKLDDDFYVREGFLEPFLRDKNRYAMYGYYNTFSIIQPKGTKNYEPHLLEEDNKLFWTNCKYYPQYAQGFYAMSRAVAEYFHDNVHLLRSDFFNEDLWVGMITWNLDVKKNFFEGFGMLAHQDICPSKNNWRILHLGSIFKKMKQIHENLNATNPCNGILAMEP